jgi:tetratricopeptide (TPR) repeat protein
MYPPPRPARPLREGKAKAVLLLVGILGVGLAAGLWWRPWEGSTTGPSGGPPDDPRLTYDGPFQNVRPEVKYVGDATCARCHLDVVRTYSQHPMGRSLTPIAPLAAGQPYDDKHHNPFRREGWRFAVEARDGKVWHRCALLDSKGQVVDEYRLPVDYAVGSGTRGYSYLSVQDGFVTQTPISWYSGKDVWDLSPGFSVKFYHGRPVRGRCLYCHANRAHPAKGTVNCYREPVFTGYAIGCERCHGPGELHVQLRAASGRAEKPDHTIVNPAHLDWELRQAVCEQCHLKGEARVMRRGRGLNDYRPGLPLHAFWDVLMRARGAEEVTKAVTHVEQMYASVCFQKSAGEKKLVCTSCHDPHVKVDDSGRVAYYKARCLECHQQHGCSLPQAERLARQPQDSCIACHMPAHKTSDIPHTATTDHRILRDPPAEVPNQEERLDHWPPLVPFYRDREGFDEAEGRRDMGVGLMELAGEGKLPAARSSELALELLEEAVRRAPDDVAALEARGIALANLGHREEAAEAFEEVLQREPGRETTLVKAALLAQRRGRLTPAVDYWRRVTEVNPTRPDARRNLARLLLRKGDWQGLRPHCRAWLDLEPQDTDARLLWARCLLREGKETEARAEFDKARRLRPGTLPTFGKWKRD